MSAADLRCASGFATIDPQGMKWRGPWGIPGVYQYGDAVEYNGSTWVCDSASGSVGIAPDAPSAPWQEIAFSSGASGQFATLDVSGAATIGGVLSMGAGIEMNDNGIGLGNSSALYYDAGGAAIVINNPAGSVWAVTNTGPSTKITTVADLSGDMIVPGQVKAEGGFAIAPATAAVTRTYANQVYGDGNDASATAALVDTSGAASFLLTNVGSYKFLKAQFTAGDFNCAATAAIGVRFFLCPADTYATFQAMQAAALTTWTLSELASGTDYGVPLGSNVIPVTGSTMALSLFVVSLDSQPVDCQFAASQNVVLTVTPWI